MMNEDYLKSNKPTLQEWIESQSNMEILVNPNMPSLLSTMQYWECNF